jgi:hypothetical protein
MQTTPLNAQLYPLYFAFNGRSVVTSDRQEVTQAALAHWESLGDRTGGCGKIYSPTPVTADEAETFVDLSFPRHEAHINLTACPNCVSHPFLGR